MRVLLFIALYALLGTSRAEGENWERTRVLDKKLGVQIWWNSTKGGDELKGWLDFEIFAPTRGYVGVGFSNNGAMRGSDIVVGWVDDDGKGHLKDFHGTGNEIPKLDEKQDYELTAASETDEGTRIRFRRKLHTCDDDDYEIANHTTRVMWSFGDLDPSVSEENEIEFYYHGATRGAVSLYMLDLPVLMPFPDEVPDPDPSIKHWDFRVNVSHSEEVMYQCMIAKFPKTNKKNHMIGFRPLITPGNEKYLHHICLYECIVPDNEGGTAATFEQHINHEGGRCYSANMPPEWAKNCVAFFATWVVGSEGEMFPEHVGIPVGEPNDAATYFMFEVHYDNPRKEAVTDNSGLRMYYTENLREYDANVLLVSYRISPFMLIPPQQQHFKTVGICSSECTAATFPEEGIKVVSVLLHGHLAMRKLKLRHFRNGKELPVLRDDKSYDYNYQQTRFLREEVTVLPGDELVTECEFQTSDRNRSTLGGLTTVQEMCQSFVMYYPKVAVALCSSQYEFHNFFDALGVKKVSSPVFSGMNVPYDPTTWPKENVKYEPTNKDVVDLENLGEGKRFNDVYDLMNIDTPESFKGKTMGEYLDFVNWKNPKYAKAVQRKWVNGKHYAYCTGHGRQRIHLKDFVIDFPVKETNKKQIKTDPACVA